MTVAASHKPRLLILTSTLPRWADDSEPRFVLDLARQMTSRFEPVILAPMAAGSAKHEILEGIRIERYRYAPLEAWHTLASPGAIMPNLRKQPLLFALVPFLFLGLFVAIFNILRRERFDAIHCHWIVPQGLMLSLVSFLLKLPPTLVTCHGGDAFTLEFQPFRAIKRWILRTSDAVTVVSEEIANHFASFVDRRRVHIPMGVDLDRFSMRSLSKVDEGSILFVGRLAEKKGLDRLIQAMADDRIVAKDVKLRIIGDGPLRADLEALAAASTNSRAIVFLGPRTHAEIAAAMHQTAIFCTPFVVAEDGDREGTPTVLMEAAACGIPIVTSDVGGCRDIVETGKSGWLIAPGDEAALCDALVDALENPAKGATMAKEARLRAEQLSWPEIGRRYSDILETILSKGVDNESKI